MNNWIRIRVWVWVWIGVATLDCLSQVQVVFSYFFLATHRTTSCSCCCIVPVLHRVVVVNVSLTVACCTKVTTEIATLIALTATAAAVHQLTSSASENLLKSKRNWTKQRRSERQSEREPNLDCEWQRATTSCCSFKPSWPTGLASAWATSSAATATGIRIRVKLRAGTGIFLPRPACRYRYRYKHTHTRIQRYRCTPLSIITRKWDKSQKM